MEQGNIIKIGVVGAESTGKTWLCEHLASHFKTAWVPEYAREYFNDSDIYNYTPDDLEIIAKKQLQLESETLPKAKKFLFCDTTLITLKIWAELEFETTPPFIASSICKNAYHHYFITDNEIPWVADRLRENKHSRELLFEMNEYEVKKTGIPYTIISGNDEQRLANAISVVGNLRNV